MLLDNFCQWIGAATIREGRELATIACDLPRVIFTEVKRTNTLDDARHFHARVYLNRTLYMQRLERPRKMTTL